RTGATTIGSGLGLSIVSRVVSAHKGTLTLKDRREGGLTVEIALPAARPITSPSSAAALWLVAIIGAALLLSPDAAQARTTQYPAPDGSNATVMAILGVTDTPLFEAFITGFQQQHPDVTVIYEETDSLPLFERFLGGDVDPAPDLLISSASDLQIKLANDGHAMAYESPYLAGLPSWAHWRNEVFGFTFEPAVIIYNPALISSDEVPRTHLTLAEMLETQTARFRGRIATYDIGLSGVG